MIFVLNLSVISTSFNVGFMLDNNNVTEINSK